MRVRVCGPGATPVENIVHVEELHVHDDQAGPPLDAQMDAGDADDTAIDNGAVRVRKAPAMQRRKPTPLQTARWNAVQKAKRRGLSIRGVARELGIPSGHGKEVHGSSEPAREARSGRIGAICYHRERYK